MPTNLTIPTAGLYRAEGDNGDAVYSFNGNNYSRYSIQAPTAGTDNNYSANHDYLNSFGVDFNSLPTFNLADVQGQMTQLPGAHALTDLAQAAAVTPTSKQVTINNNPDALALAGSAGGRLATANNQSLGISTPQPQNLASSGSLNVPTATGVVATTPQKITLGNGQVVSIDPKTGNFTDANGNPITQTQVQQSKAGTAPITPSSLAPASSSYNFTSPQGQTTNLSALQSQYNSVANTPTDAEKQQSDLIARLTDLNNQEAGKSSYQTQQNTAAGVDTANATINSLTAQLQQIQNAHATAQLTNQQGEGVTTAIDSRQRAEETRQSALQALAVSSLLDAAKGDLATAQAKADLAVKTKFDPIEAQITANTNNLNLIKNDPNTTNEDKAKAEAELTIQNQMSDAVTQAKDITAKIQTVAITAASYENNFIPNSQYRTAAQALQAIQNQTDPVAAQQIATSVGMTAPTVKTGTWSDPYMLGGNYVQKNDTTGEIRTAVNPSSTTSDTHNSDATNATLSTYLVPGQKLADGVTPVLDNNGFLTSAAWKAIVAQTPASQLSDVIQANAKYFYAPGGTADKSYNFSSTDQDALKKGLP